MVRKFSNKTGHSTDVKWNAFDAKTHITNCTLIEFFRIENTENHCELLDLYVFKSLFYRANPSHTLLCFPLFSTFFPLFSSCFSLNLTRFITISCDVFKTELWLIKENPEWFKTMNNNYRRLSASHPAANICVFYSHFLLSFVFVCVFVSFFLCFENNCAWRL